jgi:hypothetical protein
MSVHEVSNDNGIRVIYFATSKNLSNIQCRMVSDGSLLVGGDGWPCVPVPLAWHSDFSQWWSTVLTYCYSMPTDSWCKGLMHVLFTPRHCNTSCIRQDSKSWPWSLCSSWYSKVAEVHQGIRHHLCILVGDGVGLWPLDEVPRCNHKVWFL